MKFYISSSVLAKVVEIVKQTVDTKSNLPEMGAICIEAIEGGVIVSSFNLTMGTRVEIHLPTEPESYGSAYLPVTGLLSYLKKVEKEEIVLESSLDSKNNRVLEIKYKTSNIKIPLLNIDGPTSFPSFPVYAELEVEDASLLWEPLNQVSFCASVNQYQNPLMGVHGESKEHEFSAFASNGHRAAKSTSVLESIPELDGFQFPTAFVALLKKALGNKQTAVAVTGDTVSSRTLFCQKEEILHGHKILTGFFCRNLDNNFPVGGVKTVLQQKYDESEVQTLSFPKDILLAGLKSLAAVVNYPTAHIVMATEDEITTFQVASEMGEGEFYIESQIPDDRLGRIKFSLPYLTEALEAVESGATISYYLDENAPQGVIIKSWGSTLEQLLMPVKEKG